MVAAQSVEAWYALGAYSMRAGEDCAAEEALREALLLDAAHAPATVALALLHMSAEEWERAEIYAQVTTTREREREKGVQATCPCC